MPPRRAASPNSASTAIKVGAQGGARSTRRSCSASRSASSSISPAKASTRARALLIVAPMSGHYATLLRGTVERLLPSFDVYITDWRDAKLVPLSDGSFDLDDYIDYLIEFLELIGEQHRRAAAHARGLPAGGAGLRGDGADERGQEPVAAARR